MIAVVGGGGPLRSLVLAELDRREVPTCDALEPGLDAVLALGNEVDAAAAAIAAGVPYVDGTGSWETAAELLERHRDAGIPIVTGCGFDGLLGDLAAAVAAMHFGGPVDEVGVHHDRARLGAVDGRPVREVPFPGGPRWVADAALVEAVLVPRHVPGAEVITTVAVAGSTGDDFQLVAEAVGVGPTSVVVCEGRHAEVLGARFLATAALAVARPGQPTGAMAPGEAFDAEAFLDAVAGDDLRWSFSFPPPGDLSD